MNLFAGRLIVVVLSGGRASSGSWIVASWWLALAPIAGEVVLDPLRMWAGSFPSLSLFLFFSFFFLSPFPALYLILSLKVWEVSHVWLYASV